MKVHLATFYSSDLSRSAKRFLEQAENMDVYDSINVFSEKDLSDEYREYVKGLLLDGKKRGYGYWVWQPYFHKLMLSKMSEGDIYHWCDVGCHFNINGKNRLKEYIKMTFDEPTGFLGFQYKDPEFINKYPNYKFLNYMENEYTKSDLVKYFQISHQDKVMLSPQVWGGMFFFKKCPNIDKFIDKVYDIFRNRFDLIDDDVKKYIEKSVPEFITHRHGQSVLSILIKQMNCKLISAYESEWALDENGKRTFEHLKNFPIIAKRDKQKNMFKRFLDRQKKNLRRKLDYFKSQ